MKNKNIILMKTNKKLPMLVWTFLGTLLLIGLALATTYITDTSITTPEIANTTFTGSVYNFSTMDTSLKLYAKDHTTFGQNNGESLELRGMTPTAKPYIGWYGYDLGTNSYRSIGWIGCHYNLTNGDTHSHCSWETLDNTTGTPIINTHFEISYNSSQNIARVAFPNSYLDNPVINNIYSKSTDNVDIYADAAVRLWGANQETQALSITNDTNGMVLSALGSSQIQIASTDMLRLQANATKATCNLDSAGAIYYEGITLKHYGCNGTTWNALY